MPDYSKGKIYKIYSGDLCYYGSTTMRLSARIYKHRERKIKYENGTRAGNLSVFQVLNRPDYKIELVEEYPCSNKRELLLRERFYIENNNCVNINIPGRTKSEWQKANKDKKSIYNARYREKQKLKCQDLV